MVEGDVRQQRRHDPTLRGAENGTTHLPVLQHTGFQPCVNRAAQHAVAYPLVQKAAEMSVVQGIEKALDVQVNHPASAHQHGLLPEVLQGLVSRAPRAEAEATVPEVLLVDTFQHHHHGSLQHLVLERRYPDWSSLPAIPFRDVDAAHGRRDILAGLEAVEQRLEVGLQIRRLLVRRLSVQSHRPVFPRYYISRVKHVPVDVVSQAREHHVRCLSGQLGYPLSFR